MNKDNGNAKKIGKYDHTKIEKKWRNAWDEKKVYQTLNAKQAKAQKLKPYYVLDMFPYPSGAGLHVGHPRGYIASDVFARMKRMQGYNVLHPMGFDSFGLPAEQYAIKTGKNPGPFTNQLVKRYREQLSILGFSFDWDRQVNTHDPEYYRWTQWIFLQIYNSYYDEEKQKARPIAELVKKLEKADKNWKHLSEIEQQNILMKYRLAYEGYAEVNWCAELGTVLANDEIIEKDGKMVSERGEHPVVKKQMRQWFMRITAYADRLINGLDTIDWPHSIKEIQRNWIGKSEGSEISFNVNLGKKTQVIFVHGAAKSEADAKASKEGKKSWKTWLPHELRNRGIEMVSPAFPSSWSPNYEEWKAEFEKNKIDEKTILIGHSLGGAFLTRWLSENNANVAKLILVAPAKKAADDASKEFKDFYNFEIDKNLNKKVGEIVVFTSNTEMARLRDSQINVYGKIDGVKVLDLPNHGHFRFDDMGTEKFPQLLSEIISKEAITVFTTRADTLFGVTYVVLAPEHELVQKLKPEIKNWNEVEKYLTDVKAKSDEDRVAAKEKTGVELKGVFAVNPANGEQVPVWIADYVLATYGTGAVMAVPAHDERDFEFANKYQLPVKNVIDPYFVRSDVIGHTDFKEKKKIVSIVEDGKGNILTINWGPELGGRLLLGGTIEEGEDAATTALRELAEETGYVDTKIISVSEETFDYKYFATSKGTAQRALTKFVHIVLNSLQKEEDSLEDDEKGKFAVEWISIEKASKDVVEPLHKYAFNKYVAKIAYTGEGLVARSGNFDGLSTDEAKRLITTSVAGKLVTKYKMRDAIFARQRYWGEPIPLQHVSLEEKYKDAFRIPFYSAFPFDLVEAGKKNVEVRSLDKPGRDKVKVGDVVRIDHLSTKRMLFARVTEAYRFKNIRDLYERGNHLVKDIRPEKPTNSYEDFYAYYAGIDKDYEKRCDTYGMAVWRIELIKGDIIETVSEKKLPLMLPNVKSYAPTGDGQSPLAGVKSWVNAGYETNTMPGWAGSSWYFLRYADPKNKKAIAGESELDYWFGKNGGVNMYVGGAEHATGHLLYSRFWHKVLKDLGHVKTEEPFQALRNQGMIGGTDGRKMSKRWGNVINPDDVVRDLGADTMRVYEAFMGPFEASLPWSTDGIVGSRRFIERVWKLQSKVSAQKSSDELVKVLHKTIKKVNDDIPSFGFNTAVSAMMIFLNAAEKADHVSAKDFKLFLQILAPFAPHVTDELWNLMGEKNSIHRSAWPTHNPKLVVEDAVTIGVQVNGKVRAEISLAKDAVESDVRSMVMQLPEIVKWIDGKEVRKFIYVPGKIISIVV